MQLADLSFESSNPVPFLDRDTVAHAVVFLGLHDMSAQDLEIQPNFGATAAIVPDCVAYEP